MLLLALSELTETRTCLLAMSILIKSKSKIDHIELLGNYFYSEDHIIISCLILIKFNIGTTSDSGISPKTKVIFKHILTFFKLKTLKQNVHKYFISYTLLS
jgi:hypothetical protein